LPSFYAGGSIARTRRSRIKHRDPIPIAAYDVAAAIQKNGPSIRTNLYYGIGTFDECTIGAVERELTTGSAQLQSYAVDDYIALRHC